MSVYYIDYTTGDDADTGLTEALAWKTIAKVNAASFSPDDQILFKCGEVWRETLIPPTSGTSGHQITFGDYSTGAKPLISAADVGAPTTPVRNYCIYDTDAISYITIDGIEVAYAVLLGIANDQWTGEGVEVATPSWIVQNCTATKCGIVLFGPNSIVQDNTLVGPQPTAALAGAVIFEGAVAANCSALRNTISGFYGRGIWFLRAADAPIANDNVVHDIAFSYGTSDNGYGINFDGYGYLLTGTITATGNTVYNCASQGIKSENCSDGSLIRNNTIHDCAENAILLMNYDAYAGRYADQRGNHTGAVVAYNVIYDCRYGVKLWNVAGTSIWNNDFYNGTGSYPKAIIMITASTYCHAHDIRNNIVDTGWVSALSVPHEDGTFTAFITAYDYNRVPATGCDAVTEEGAHWRTLAAVQALGYMTHGFSTDPGFVDAANHNFHLAASSPCINAGVDVGLTTDYAGSPVPSGGIPDIGAYENQFSRRKRNPPPPHVCLEGKK